MQYSIQKTVSLDFDAALARVREELKKEGFGVLTEIDIRDTMKKKLNEEFRDYRILGACNPSFAWKALQVEDRIGLMLPCNVVVQKTRQGAVEVAAIDPAASMNTVGNPQLMDIARQVQEKLTKVIAALPG
jgi:uncharacterized protein (DUF302 family)